MDLTGVCRTTTYKIIITKFPLQLLGTLVILFIITKTLLSYAKTRRESQTLHKHLQNHPSLLTNLINKHNIDPNKVWYVHRQDRNAQTIGLFRPIIVITDHFAEQLSSEELEAVLLHELHHQTHFHGLLLLIARISSSTLFFLPSLRDIYFHLLLLLEHQADSFSVTVQQTNKYLKSALTKTLIASPQVVPAFAAGMLEQRITLLQNPQTVQPGFHINRAIISLVMILTTGWLIHARKVTMLSTLDQETFARCTVPQLLTPAHNYPTTMLE